MNRFNKSQPHYVAVVEQLTKTFDEIVSSIAKQGKNVLKVLDVGGGMYPLSSLFITPNHFLQDLASSLDT